MPSFYFPCLALKPLDLPRTFRTSGFGLHVRQWEITTFDFATLATKHNLHFSYKLLDLFMGTVNCEVEVCDCEDHEAAQVRVRCLQAMLYCEGLSPFIMPAALTHPMVDYSGLNSRDSEALRQNLPTGLRNGFTSEDGKIEGWIHEPTLECIYIKEKMTLTERAFEAAAGNVPRWLELERSNPPLATARKALQTAPVIPDVGSSLLHAWQGIEALFPSISTEISFRLSLLIAQLCAPVRANRDETYRESKGSYAKRSRAAHGNFRKIGYYDWLDAWDLLALCMAACLKREKLPSEDELTAELLS